MSLIWCGKQYSYQISRYFHHKDPTEPHIIRFKILTTKPSFHHSLVVRYPAPKNIGALAIPKCVIPLESTDKNARSKAAIIGGTFKDIKISRKVGYKTVAWAVALANK